MTGNTRTTNETEKKKATEDQVILFLNTTQKYVSYDLEVYRSVWNKWSGKSKNTEVGKVMITTSTRWWNVGHEGGRRGGDIAIRLVLASFVPSKWWWYGRCGDMLVCSPRYWWPPYHYHLCCIRRGDGVKMEVQLVIDGKMARKALNGLLFIFNYSSIH